MLKYCYLTVRRHFMKEYYVNPIDVRGADPWVVKHGDIYYYCFSIGNGVAVSKADNIHLISRNGGVIVYTAPVGTSYSAEYWAPELHYIRGRWYIYVAADDGDNFNHRMYCLGSLTDDPQGEYEMLGKVSDPSDKWAIDATVLEHEDKLYFIWSGWEGDENVAQNIYIAPMSDPHTVCGDRILLSKPEYEWEKRACVNGLPTINEGPEILKKDNTVHIVYSASGSWSDEYCLGLLTFRGGDILDPASWTKSDKPLFSKIDTAYGPGHCSFTVSPSGKEDWIVYHANIVSGTSWGGRSVRAQKFGWNGDMPVFGEPLKAGEQAEIPE